jgi:hypothetical protein
LVDVRVEMLAFQLEYDSRLGRMAAELAQVEAELKRCQRQADHYRSWGPDGPPKSRSGHTHIPVEEQFRRAWQQPKRPRPSAPPEPMTPATKVHIKKLYRQLCRRFHPDLTQDPDERVWRTEIMAAINAAYEARSLVELEALAQTPDRARPRVLDTDEQRLAALRSKWQQIQRRLREVESELSDLRNSEMLQLSLDARLLRRQGRDLLAEIAAGIERDLERKKVELDFLRAQLKQAGLAS